MSQPHVLVERRGHVAVVTLNRPEARNALGLEMFARLHDAWDEIDGDPEVRVAVVTGAGGTFCAGADLKAMHASREGDPWFERFRADPDIHWKGLLRHRTLTKPLVAAVEGAAFAGGAELLLSTDVRVAAETARFGLTEARWGLFPLGGSTVRLQRQIGYTNAMELLLTATPIDAAEALRVGLVGRVVPEGQALEVALVIANRIASNGPLAVQAIKRSVVETGSLPEAEGLARELAIGQPIFATADAREGPRAFAERREPVFEGR